ncbi:MAG TPA: AMP-binding protein [Trebonia sp.]|nr:AMP-binding protein [Trebonia sp.]
MADEPTLAAHILAGAAAHDGCPLVFAAGSAEQATTLGALVSDAERAAAALQARGIGPGDVIAVQLPGSYAGAVIQVAAGLCGAVLLPVVMIYGPREMDFVLRRSGAAAVVLPREHRGRPHADAVLSGLSRLPALKFAVVVGDDDAPGQNTVGHGAVGYTELLRQPGGTYRQPSPDPGDRAVLMYTSGTTAEPKGVQHSHRTLLAEATSRVYTLNGPGARHLGLFPPGHMAGLLSLLRILLLGTPTVIMQAWDAAQAARLIVRHAVTSCGGAPVQLSGLLDQQAAGTAELGTLREFLTGAAPVPPSLIRRADAAGIAAFRSYGSSEHPTVSAGTIADSLGRRAGTDGRLLAGNQVRLVDAGGRDVPDGKDGEILTRGPELFSGYTDPELNAAAFLPGGWFRTGDVGRTDADGYLTVTDRLKDIIIRGGENISAKEVEDLLVTHPAVADVAVIPSPDQKLGERVCAVVVPRPGFTFDVEQARAHFAAAGAARQKTPEVVVLVDELPRTPSGKVRKDVLRAARQAEASGSGP